MIRCFAPLAGLEPATLLIMLSRSSLEIAAPPLRHHDWSREVKRLLFCDFYRLPNVRWEFRVRPTTPSLAAPDRGQLRSDKRLGEGRLSVANQWDDVGVV